MALRGAIAGCGVAEFTGIAVGTAVVVDIEEVEADDPGPDTEDHRRPVSKEAVDSLLKDSRKDGMKLGKRVVVGIRSTCGVGDCLDGFLSDSSLPEGFPEDPGVEAAVFDSGNQNLRQEAVR